MNSILKSIIGIVVAILIGLIYLATEYIPSEIIGLGVQITVLLFAFFLSKFLLKEYYYLQQIIIYLCLIGIILTISNYYDDNYSIQKLVDIFELKEFGTIDYKILLSEHKGINKCKINGDYKGNRLNKIEYEYDNNDDFCNKKYEAGNLDHLGKKKN
tara:strand:- start:75 stop:545 length:471 start_codon:yes stop_codon:yes gene_type:complete